MPLRTIQIISAALIAGLLTLTAIMGGFAYARVATPAPALIAPLAGAAALSIPACVLVGVAVKSSQLQQARLHWLREHDDDEHRAIEAFEDAYARGTLVQLAAIEGFGLLGATCALVTGQLLFLVSPMLAIIGIGLVFPTEAKFRAIVTHLTRPPDERETRFIESQRPDSR